MRWFLALAGATLGSGACYVHSAVEEPAPAPGTEVEVTITPSYGGDTLRWGSSIRILDGRVLKSGPDTLALAVSRALGAGEISTQKWHGDRIAVPREAVVKVERRQLSFLRTGLLLGAGFVAAVALDHAVSTPPVLR